ncbi:hypothetical protein GCK72_019580 [Caenorhabditis remanei]|uniref:Serpentine Receptor, class H n=1 Tax=Caenorhabditis remanei TaxID=31234 RepID=A0A6A5GE59_CAERE|nr:hypothetical protein GCK72_019580 [Caenorhabditis remanei]KAF1753024.1 hypothetical protein GCK72_019580 [Caenorhabditis remanei]
MNNSMLSYFYTPRFLNDALNLMTCIEIPIHILGVYCILYKTPDSMKSVKWSMFNLLFWSVILDLGVSVLTSPFLLFPTFSGYPLGVLKYVGVSTEVQTYMIVMVYAMVGTAILTLFENRFFLMFARYHPWRRYRSIFLLINYILAAFFFIPAYFAIPEQTEALQKVFNVLPKLPEVILNAPLFVLATDLSLVLLSVLFMAILLVTENAAFVILLYCKMKIRTRRMSTSQYTLNLQKKFLRAIYIQVSTPFLILITPLTYTFFSVVFGVYNQAANNMCTILFAFHGLTSTITVLLFHKSYRKACFGLITFDMFQKGTTSSVVVPSRSTGVKSSVCRRIPSTRTESLNSKSKSVFVTIIVMLPSVAFAWTIFGWYHNQALNNFIMIVLAQYGIGSTIVMISVHKPYRDIIIDKLCRCPCLPKKKSSKFRNYRFLLLFFALFNLTYSVVNVIVPLDIHSYRYCFFLILKDGWFVESSEFNFHLMTGRCSLVAASYAILLIHFIYRYLAIHNSSFTKQNFHLYMTFAVFVFALYFGVWHAICYFPGRANMEIRQYIREEFRETYGNDSMDFNMLGALFHEGSDETRGFNYVEVSALGVFAFVDPVAIILCLPIFRLRIFHICRGGSMFSSAKSSSAQSN